MRYIIWRGCPAPAKEAAMETGRLKMVLLAAGIAGLLLAAGSVMLGALTEDADAARSTQLKTLWAVVNPDGTLVRGKGVTSISKPATGEYEVKFRQDVSRCAYSATFDHASGFIFISLRDSNIGAREVGVTTTDRGAVVRNSPFHLVVNC
jgi:hypothetical protein